MQATYDNETDKLILTLTDKPQNTYDYAYDDWITISYEKSTGNLSEIIIDGMSRIQDEGYSSYDPENDLINIQLSNKPPVGCDMFYFNKKRNILFSINRDEHGNLLGIELMNIGEFMLKLLK